MRVLLYDSIPALLAQEYFECKMVLNEKGAILFPLSLQHRTVKGEGISYEDDSLGNALAAIVKKGLIEIRGHKSFSDERVRTLIAKLLSSPELAFAREYRFMYRGASMSKDNH